MGHHHGFITDLLAHAVTPLPAVIGAPVAGADCHRFAAGTPQAGAVKFGLLILIGFLYRNRLSADKADAKCTCLKGQRNRLRGGTVCTGEQCERCTVLRAAGSFEQRVRLLFGAPQFFESAACFFQIFRGRVHGERAVFGIKNHTVTGDCLRHTVPYLTQCGDAHTAGHDGRMTGLAVPL